MTPQEYTGHAAKTAVYPREHERDYLALGLLSELGEVAGVLKRVLRDDAGVLTAERALAGRKEVGDCLWYLAMLSTCTSDYQWNGEAFCTLTEWPEPFVLNVTLHAAAGYVVAAAAAVEGGMYGARDFDYSDVVDALVRCARLFGASLEECAVINVAKLSDRAGRGVIHGAGDARQETGGRNLGLGVDNH